MQFLQIMEGALRSTVRAVGPRSRIFLAVVSSPGRKRSCLRAYISTILESEVGMQGRTNCIFVSVF